MDSRPSVEDLQGFLKIAADVDRVSSGCNVCAAVDLDVIPVFGQGKASFPSLLVAPVLDLHLRP